MSNQCPQKEIPMKEKRCKTDHEKKSGQFEVKYESTAKGTSGFCKKGGDDPCTVR